MNSIESIRASSGEGLPICIDSARIFSSDPKKAGELVYVRYKDKRYYASNPTELAENIESLIRGNPLPSAAERLPQEESAARALVGSQVDTAETAAPKRSSPLGSAFGRMGADLKWGAKTIQGMVPSRKAPDAAAAAAAPVANAPVPASKKNSPLWGALKRAGTDAGTAGKAIGSAASATGSFIGKRFTRKNGAAAPTATLSPGLQETLSIAKVEASRPGSVAAGTPAAAPTSAVPERKTAANLKNTLTPEEIAKAADKAAAAPAAPAGGSRRRKERRRRPLTAPTRRARHQVKAHK
jgi:hypothetical protein